MESEDERTEKKSKSGLFNLMSAGESMVVEDTLKAAVDDLPDEDPPEPPTDSMYAYYQRYPHRRDL